MKSRNVFKVIAPILVVIGIATFIWMALRLAVYFNVRNLFSLLKFMPKWVIQFVGIMNIVTFFPMFIFGFLHLGRDGAIGKADTLRTQSMYKYVRNPMYAGVSFTVFGIGLLVGSTACSIAGILWLIICFFVSKLEERSLTKRFGTQYVNYLIQTPGFIPKFEIMIIDFLKLLKNLMSLRSLRK